MRTKLYSVRKNTPTAQSASLFLFATYGMECSTMVTTNKAITGIERNLNFDNPKPNAIEALTQDTGTNRSIACLPPCWLCRRWVNTQYPYDIRVDLSATDC